MVMWLIGVTILFGFMYLLFRNNYRRSEFLRNAINFVKGKKEGISDEKAVVIFTLIVWAFVSIISTLTGVLIALLGKIFELLIMSL